MSIATEAGRERQTARNGWLLSAPALLILTAGAIGPLLIVLVYSFLTPAEYSGVEWIFSGESWFRVFWKTDIFDGTVSLNDTHLAIFWRSVKLSVTTTLITFAVGLPTEWFIATLPPDQR